MAITKSAPKATAVPVVRYIHARYLLDILSKSYWHCHLGPIPSRQASFFIVPTPAHLGAPLLLCARCRLLQYGSLAVGEIVITDSKAVACSMASQTDPCPAGRHEEYSILFTPPAGIVAEQQSSATADLQMLICFFG